LPSAIGNVAQLTVTDDGAVFVAEQKPARVTLYDRNGEFDRVVMAPGEGPGEVRDASIAAQGNAVLVYDNALTRLTWLSSDGKVVGSRRMDAYTIGGAIYLTRDGRAIVDASMPNPAWNGGFLRAGRSGPIDSVVWSHPATEDLTIEWRWPHGVLKARTPFAPDGVETVDPAGHLVIGGSKRSQWVVVDGHDTITRVSFPDHAVRIPTKERDSVWTAWFSHLPKLPDIDKVVRKDLIPTTLPPWVTFNVDQAGRWWIGRPLSNGALGSWDVVSDGKVIGHIAVPTAIVRATNGRPLMVFGSQFVALMHEDESGEPWIGVYRIVR
jgi:hypothetical protein